MIPVLLGVLLFSIPDEWILGGLDPGSYVNAGAAIARSGSIVQYSSTLASLSPEVRTALFPAPASRLPGFYLEFLHFNGLDVPHFAVATDRVVPHGLHLFPSVLALGYALGGIHAELLVTPILAVLGLIGFYLLIHRLFGTAIACIATTLLALNPAEVWFARYPDAEILAQFLLFNGLLAFVIMLDTSDKWPALLAGFSLGMVHLDKIELLPLPFLILFYLGYRSLVEKFDRVWLWFLASYAFVLVQAILHAILVANWYVVTTLQAALSVHFLIAVGALIVVSLVLATLLFLNRSFRRSTSNVLRAPRFVAATRVIITALIVLAAAYAYYVRPLGLMSVPASAPGFDGLANELDSFVRLGWYVTPLGLLLGAVGWMLLSAREINHRTALLFLFIAADTVIFLFNPDITPIHYWTARRWITLIIPGFALAQAYLLVQIWPKKRPTLTEAALPVALVFVLAMGLYSGLRPLLGYVEYRGAIDQVGSLADAIPANGVVLFANGDTGIRFSVPFEYIFGRTSLLITTDARMDQAAGVAARQWLNEGRPVYWITNPGLPGPAEIGLSGTLVLTRTILLPEKIATTSVPPGADGAFQQTVQIWQLRP